ncbi:hypothetical protein COY62_00195, partial [bacterium (Candidatus Howlettbacteria) CG_4_10_14_0_8_um_filter_40_9]
MANLTPVKANALIDALSKLGFFESRQKGSHLIMKHPDGRMTVIPLHSNKEIPKGTLSAILRDIKVSPD